MAGKTATDNAAFIVAVHRAGRMTSARYYSARQVDTGLADIAALRQSGAEIRVTVIGHADGAGVSELEARRLEVAAGSGR